MYLTVEELAYKINNLTTNMSKLRMAYVALLKSVSIIEQLKDNPRSTVILGVYPRLSHCSVANLDKWEEEYRSPLVPDLNIWDLVTLVELCNNYYLKYDLSLTDIPLKDFKKLIAICPFVNCYDRLIHPSMPFTHDQLSYNPDSMRAFPSDKFSDLDVVVGDNSVPEAWSSLSLIDVYLTTNLIRPSQGKVPFEALQSNYLYILKETFDTTGLVRQQLNYRLEHFTSPHRRTSDPLSPLDKRRMGRPILCYAGKYYVDTRLNTASKTRKWKKRIAEAQYKYLIRGDFNDN